MLALYLIVKWFALLAMWGLAGCATAPPRQATFSTLPPPHPPLVLSVKAPVRPLTPKPQTQPLPNPHLAWDNQPGMVWDVYVSDDMAHWLLMGRTATNGFPISTDNPWLFFTVVTVNPTNGLTSLPLPPP